MRAGDGGHLGGVGGPCRVDSHAQVRETVFRWVGDTTSCNHVITTMARSSLADVGSHSVGDFSHPVDSKALIQGGEALQTDASLIRDDAAKCEDSSALWAPVLASLRAPLDAWWTPRGIGSQERSVEVCQILSPVSRRTRLTDDSRMQDASAPPPNTPQNVTTPDTAARLRDGRQDFDFLFGSWHVRNRKLADPLAMVDTEWLEFDGSTIVRPILGGLGNIEQYLAPQFPGRSGFEGMTLRLFEPTSGLWRIWWASTARPGVLETPMLGQFVDGRGTFYCDDIVNGVALKVRFDWQVLDQRSARWEQSFSFDGGASWRPNWVWSLSRE